MDTHLVDIFHPSSSAYKNSILIFMCFWLSMLNFQLHQTFILTHCVPVMVSSRYVMPYLVSYFVTSWLHGLLRFPYCVLEP